MTYPEVIRYLESFINYEKITGYSYKSAFRLERMHNLLDLFGHPERKFNSIHIAGSKGKGSVSAMVFSILTEANFKAGLNTSPHLIDFRERIRIAEDKYWRLITEEEVVSLVEEMKPKVDFLKERPSFFELYTALAFLYFARLNLHLVVAEVGLGGRLDATNVLNPLVCGITSLSFEHTDKLGNTLTSIAGEECGIIKENVIVVTAPQEDEAMKVIKENCCRKNAHLYEVGRNIFFEELGFDNGKEIFNLRGNFSEYAYLEMPLLGRHQLINAGVALGIIEALRNYGIYVSAEAVRAGFKKVYWPGRLEVIEEMPPIILDGAHNQASARALKEAVKKCFQYARLILVLGISKDKDIKGICQELTEIADEVILTKANNPRAEEPENISCRLQAAGCRHKIYLTNNVGEAIGLARKRAEEEDLILVTGSLFLVGEARKIILPPNKIQNLTPDILRCIS